VKASLRTLAEQEAEAEAAVRRERPRSDEHERLDELKAMRAELLEAAGPGKHCSLRHRSRNGFSPSFHLFILLTFIEPQGDSHGEH
jgi:hypothetical protein